MSSTAGIASNFDAVARETSSDTKSVSELQLNDEEEEEKEDRSIAVRYMLNIDPKMISRLKV